MTRRDVRLPGVAGKAFAVIGVRRGGKTSFLAQCRADRLAAGRPGATQLFISLEDERLAGMTVADLGWLIEEHTRHFPGLREAQGMTLYLDEVQTVPGWEGLVRRLMDAGGLECFVSGSSAKLLSREVATSLRGRAMDVLVHPFSFREALRHAGAEPAGPLDRLTAPGRAALDQRLRRYLDEGGFPEAQGATPGDRAALLGSYVDGVVLRDVIERHAVSHPLALRWIERQLLANPGGSFSVKKHYDTLRSQGVSVGKDTLHQYLAHLEDAFLVRTVAMHSASERQRMVNPRKAYPVDPGLIALFERSGRALHGHALETVVMLELERRGFEVAYVRTAEGFEVDFRAHRAGDAPLLLQVCLESEGDETWERELRALEAAAATHPDARPVLVTLDAVPPRRPLPQGVSWAPAAHWLLGG
ncbi:MAG: ATP-binding protein [Acidobacteria bacterium]|nr:ATP-binding protein [Acidobacteriota bacterium]